MLTQTGKSFVRSQDLKEAQVYIYTDHKALTVMFQRAKLKYTENKMIIAGGYEDACQGDPGGPLTCIKDKKPYLCGIVSWRMDCKDQDNQRYPGVYTDVRQYAEWITNQLNLI